MLPSAASNLPRRELHEHVCSWPRPRLAIFGALSRISLSRSALLVSFKPGQVSDPTEVDALLGGSGGVCTTLRLLCRVWRGIPTRPGQVSSALGMSPPRKAYCPPFLASTAQPYPLGSSDDSPFVGCTAQFLGSRRRAAGGRLLLSQREFFFYSPFPSRPEQRGRQALPIPPVDLSQKPLLGGSAKVSGLGQVPGRSCSELCEGKKSVGRVHRARSDAMVFNELVSVAFNFRFRVEKMKQREELVPGPANPTCRPFGKATPLRFYQGLEVAVGPHKERHRFPLSKRN